MWLFCHLKNSSIKLFILKQLILVKIRIFNTLHMLDQKYSCSLEGLKKNIFSASEIFPKFKSSYVKMNGNDDFGMVMSILFFIEVFIID